MALTPFQRELCRLLADRRKAGGESYIAGGVALNVLTQGLRRSHDIDLFHDTEEAVRASADADRALFGERGYSVRTLREREAFIEALVEGGAERVLVQWARDSAYRFFPLVGHEELGLTLHPFDLATNKLLALVGRREPRDWIDLLRCHELIQPLAYLAWAASGKDPGFGPLSIVEEAARTRYVQAEIESLEFEGSPPDAAALSRQWHACISEARAVIPYLPPSNVGCCVLDERGELFRGKAHELTEALRAGRVSFRSGSIRGVLPEIRRG